MPPPNHQTGSASPCVASSARTFMCAVGQKGFSGCSTSETPIAANARPASSGRLAVAEAGSAAPLTFEKAMPPRSKTRPPSMMQVQPLPLSGAPASFCQRSTRKRLPSLPSIASAAVTRRVCRLVK